MPVVCGICDKPYSAQKNLNAHIKSAHDLERFFCKVCDSNFTTPYSLRHHVTTIHGTNRSLKTLKITKGSITEPHKPIKIKAYF